MWRRKILDINPQCSLIIGTGCRVEVFSLILDSSVGLSAGIRSAGDLVSDTPGLNPAFSRGRQLVSFRFEYRLPVPEHRNYQQQIIIYAYINILHEYIIILHVYIIEYTYIHTYLAYRHNYLACIHNYIACIHNDLAWIRNYPPCIHNYLACIHN